MLPFLCTLTFAGSQPDGWRNVNDVTWQRNYTALLRDGSCVTGQIVSSGDQTLNLKPWIAPTVILKRDDILRLTDDQSSSPRNTVYTGRTSWSDLKAAEARGTEYLNVTMRDGKERKLRTPKIYDDAIMIGTETFLKAEIQWVSYVRFRPLTTDEENLHRRSGDFLAPRLWFGALFLGKISVPMYNSDRMEDNTPASCHK